MEYIKRIAVILLIALISICAVFYSYYGIKNGAVVFAEDNTQLLTNDELDIAISSWLQSHGGNLFSPSNYRARKTYEAGLIHNFVYGISDGYDGIRQHIKGGIGGNNELRFDFDGFILERLNTWLNQKLQNGEFGLGVQLQENGLFNGEVDNELYNGGLFVDDENNACLLFVVTNTFDYSNSQTDIRSTYIKQYGTPLKYNSDDLVAAINNNNLITITVNQITYTFDGYIVNNDSYSFDSSANQIAMNAIKVGTPFKIGTYNKIESGEGYTIAFLNQNDNKVYIGRYSYSYGIYATSRPQYSARVAKATGTQNNTYTPAVINFYTNNNMYITNYPDIDVDGKLYITPKVKINGEYKPYTVNEGDTINNVINNYYTDSNTKDKTISEPSDNPNGGGANNPIGGTPPNWNNPWPNLSSDGEGGFNFNFTLPDLNIDWNINGLTQKFPFSIPFDFIAFCRVLNAEPQTPEWSGTLTLPMVNYPFTFSLQQFDNVATILRNMEFIGFCIALILATRALIKG